MTLDKLYRELTWDLNPFREDYVHPLVCQDHDVTILGLDIFKPEFVAFLKSAGFVPLRVLFFNRVPGRPDNDPHIDGNPRQLNYSVNWSIAEAQVFKWYRLKDPSKRVNPVQYGPVRALRFAEDEVEEIAALSSRGPTLLNVSVPHKGVNLGTTNRWVYSIRFLNQFPTWEEAVKAFKPWIM